MAQRKRVSQRHADQVKPTGRIVVLSSDYDPHHVLLDWTSDCVYRARWDASWGNPNWLEIRGVIPAKRSELNELLAYLVEARCHGNWLRMTPGVNLVLSDLSWRSNCSYATPGSTELPGMKAATAAGLRLRDLKNHSHIRLNGRTPVYPIITDFMQWFGQRKELMKELREKRLFNKEDMMGDWQRWQAYGEVYKKWRPGEYYGNRLAAI